MIMFLNVSILAVFSAGTNVVDAYSSIIAGPVT